MKIRPQAHATELIDNDQIRVTRFEFAPGAETGWHEHGFDYTVTTLTDCTMQIETNESVTVVETKSWEVYFRKAGVQHNVVNHSEVAMAFVELELKT